MHNHRAQWRNSTENNSIENNSIENNSIENNSIEAARVEESNNLRQRRVDLNCDLGESFGAWSMGCDEAILPLITSANIACGFHAGDFNTMRKTVELALDYEVAIGAHPGLPDLQGFGRRNITITAKEAYNMVVYQVGALQGFISALGGRLHHVKPHGALYNMAATNESLALAIAHAIADLSHGEAILYGLSGSALIRAGREVGLSVMNEVFADRTYQTDGTLTSRLDANALITDHKISISQVLQMVESHSVTTVTGEVIALEADTICVHGDGASALQFVEEIRHTFAERQILITADTIKP